MYYRVYDPQNVDGSWQEKPAVLLMPGVGDATLNGFVWITEDEAMVNHVGIVRFHLRSQLPSDSGSRVVLYRLPGRFACQPAAAWA